MSMRTDRSTRIIAVVVGLSLGCPRPITARDDGARLIQLIQADQEAAEIAPGATWPDVSTGALENLEAHDRATLAELHAIFRSALSPENRELYDLLEWQIHSRLDEMRVRLYLTPFWHDRRLFPGGGLLSALDPLWSLPKPVALSDYEQRIRRFELFPDYVKQVIALLREARSARMLPAHQLAWPAMTSVARWLNDKPGMVRNYFATITEITEAERTLYAPFQSMDGIDPADRTRLQERARKTIRERVIPAIEEYYDTLSQEYLPACPESPSLSQWPNGVEIYKVLLRLSTTADVDPKQVQDFGSQEVVRLRAEMGTLVRKIGFNGSLDDFLVHARGDPEFYFGSGEQLLAAYRSAVQQVEPLVPKVVLDIPKLNIRVEGVNGGAAAWYAAPNAKHDYDLVNVEIGTPAIHPKFEVIPLMLHEALPGHALQHAVAREFASGGTDAVAAFKQQARQSTGFGEGWGLYSEALGYDLGLYRSPMDEFGALRMQLTRAVRIVVDTGIHLSGWTLEQAKDYAAVNTGEPKAQIELEVGRAVVPGVQPAYTVGEQQIKVMRDISAKKLGETFDIRRFDETMLRWGPLPLEVMRRKLQECLGDQRCAQTLSKE